MKLRELYTKNIFSATNFRVSSTSHDKCDEQTSKLCDLVYRIVHGRMVDLTDGSVDEWMIHQPEKMNIWAVG